MSEAWKPHAYQRRGVRFLVERGAAALFFDPGLGKTSTLLAAFSLLKRQGMVSKLLVVAPLRVCYHVWPAEIAKWRDFERLTVAILHGPRAKRRAALAADADVYVINPEGLEWLAEEAPPSKFDMLGVDESTKFKNHRAKRSKLLRRLCDRFARRYLLTGTPAPNGLLDLWGQIALLDGGRTLGTYYTHYRDHWFEPVGFGGYSWRPKKGAEQEIYAALAPLVMRLDQVDYLELPELIKTDVEVELTPAARRIYATLEIELVAKLKGGEVTAVNAAVATAKLRQLASGGVYLDVRGQRQAEDVHDVKTEATLELLEELGGRPTLVAYDTRHDLARLKRALPDAPHLGGGVGPAATRDVLERWNAGEVPALLVQPQAVAHGLNLQGAGRAVIWYSLTWDLEAYDQLIRRVWRQGQQERVFVYHLIARDTIDEAVLAALRSKDRTQRALLDALRERYLPRKPRATSKKRRRR